MRSFYDVTTSPMQVWHAGGVETAAYLHWLCALVQRHEVTSIGGGDQGRAIEPAGPATPLASGMCDHLLHRYGEG